MIKIFCSEQDRQLLNAWQETNGLSLKYGNEKDAKTLDISVPAVVDVENSTVKKKHAEGMDAIMKLPLSTLDRFRAQ